MEFNEFRWAVFAFAALTPFLLLRPKLLIYAYLGIIFYFPYVLKFGVSENVKYLSLYSAGSGMLPLPLINLYLYGIFLLTLVIHRRGLGVAGPFSAMMWLLGVSVFYGVYAFVGVALGAPVNKIVDGHSTINVVNMTLLMVVLLRTFGDEAELRRLVWFMVFCVVTRDIYGVFRFLFQDGDISNVYANVEKIAIKLTFQDINDSLLACMVCFYSAWELLFRWRVLSLSRRLVYGVIVALTTFTIMFSFRRSAWIGLFLAGGLLVLKQPLKRRIQVGVLVGIVAAFILTTLLTMRLGQYEHKGTLLFYDIVGKQGTVTTEEGRFTELAAGLNAINENWLFGVGPWGHFAGSRDYMHGGILQIWLKLGIIGLVLFSLAFISFGFFYLKESGKIRPEIRPFFEMGTAGVLFLVPTYCVGTPVLEFRTMQLTGFCLALPYISYFIAQRKLLYEALPNTDVATCISAETMCKLESRNP